MKNERLQGRVALVTGGAGGIGLAVCRRLQAEGARIVVGDIGEERVLAAAASLGEGRLAYSWTWRTVRVGPPPSGRWMRRAGRWTLWSM